MIMMWYSEGLHGMPLFTKVELEGYHGNEPLDHHYDTAKDVMPESKKFSFVLRGLLLLLLV